MKVTKNAGFLKAVICNLAEDYYQGSVIDEGLESQIIGPGLDYETKQDWIKEIIKEWFDEVTEKIVPFEKGQIEIPINKEVVKLSNKFYHCPLGKTFNFNQGLIARVPGGWIYSTNIGGDISNIFIPFSNEFESILDEENIDEILP